MRDMRRTGTRPRGVPIPSKRPDAGDSYHYEWKCSFCSADATALADVGRAYRVPVCAGEGCRAQLGAVGPIKDVKPIQPKRTEVPPMTRETDGRKRKQVDFATELTEEQVAQWAAWRREGETYAAITKRDRLSPSLPTIKRYLEEYGWAADGTRLDEEAEAPPPETPEVPPAPAPVRRLRSCPRGVL